MSVMVDATILRMLTIFFVTLYNAFDHFFPTSKSFLITYVVYTHLEFFILFKMF